MSGTPEISVIMSVYNGETYLKEAIDSIIGQTFSDWELIVINDCSTDGTGSILEQYEKADDRIRVYTNEVNLRLPSSLNKALSLARGTYTARMDADDICMPDRLEKQLAFMKSNPEIDLSSCRFMTLKNGVIASGGCGGRCDDEAIKALLLVTNPILHPGILAKTEVMQRLMYDPSCTCTEDLELWTRMAKQGLKMQIQSAYLMLYRLHDKQITGTTKERQRKEVLAVEKRYLELFSAEMTPEQEQFYINGIYFTEEPDVKRFCHSYHWMKNINRKKRVLSEDAIDYAFFEILAEYKRSGVSKAGILFALLHFPLPFLLKEGKARKVRGEKERNACVAAAKTLGLEPVPGSKLFPVFQKIRE